MRLRILLFAMQFLTSAAAADTPSDIEFTIANARKSACTMIQLNLEAIAQDQEATALAALTHETEGSEGGEAPGSAQLGLYTRLLMNQFSTNDREQFKALRASNKEHERAHAAMELNYQQIRDLEDQIRTEERHGGYATAPLRSKLRGKIAENAALYQDLKKAGAIESADFRRLDDAVEYALDAFRRAAAEAGRIPEVTFDSYRSLLTLCMAPTALPALKHKSGRVKACTNIDLKRDIVREVLVYQESRLENESPLSMLTRRKALEGIEIAQLNSPDLADRTRKFFKKERLAEMPESCSEVAVFHELVESKSANETILKELPAGGSERNSRKQTGELKQPIP